MDHFLSEVQNIINLPQYIIFLSKLLIKAQTEEMNLDVGQSKMKLQNRPEGSSQPKKL